MNQFFPGKDEKIKVHGRTRMQNPLPLFWTASGIELCADGSELTIVVTSDYEYFEQWVRIELDGYSLIRMPLNKGTNRITAYRGADPSVKKIVRLYKEVQAMPDDPSAMLLVDMVETDGLLYELPGRERKIEFIGDSITSGEGMAGAEQMMDWISAVFSTKDHYTGKVAQALNADYRIISQSGWGVQCGWNNDPHSVIPPHYTRVCGVIKGDRNQKLGAGEENDFGGWRPEVVVVNLGTNDSISYEMPEWIDEDGTVYRQKKLPDGSCEPESRERFVSAVTSFLKTLRECNPDAQILWVYGMLDDSLREQIEEGLERHIAETGDRKAHYLGLPDTLEAWLGSRAHPGPLSHEAAANVISQWIKTHK